MQTVLRYLLGRSNQKKKELLIFPWEKCQISIFNLAVSRRHSHERCIAVYPVVLMLNVVITVMNCKKDIYIPFFFFLLWFPKVNPGFYLRTNPLRDRWAPRQGSLPSKFGASSGGARILV